MIATQPRMLIDALNHTIVGQHDVVESLVLGLIADGHVLLDTAKCDRERTIRRHSSHGRPSMSAAPVS